MTLSPLQTDPARAGRDGAGTVTYVTFDLAGQTLAADVAVIREILDHQTTSPLPNPDPGLIGMIDLRGEGIAVLDLARHLGLPGEGAKDRFIVIDRSAFGGSVVAVTADRVRNVVEIPAADIDTVPDVPGGWRAEAMTGVIRIDGRLAYVIDLGVALGLAGTGEDASPRGPFDFD